MKRHGFAVQVFCLFVEPQIAQRLQPAVKVVGDQDFDEARSELIVAFVVETSNVDSAIG